MPRITPRRKTAKPKPPAASKLCGAVHPDYDPKVTCSRKLGHSPKRHQGNVSPGMSTQWDDADALCEATSPDRKLSCNKLADHGADEPHEAVDSDGEIRVWNGRKWFETSASEATKLTITTASRSIETTTDELKATAARLKGEVDGKPAIIDGTIPKEAQQMRLIQANPDEIMKRLRAKHRQLALELAELDERKLAHTEQKGIVDKLQIEHNAIVSELCDATKDGSAFAKVAQAASAAP